MTNHIWIASNLGHGESMCSRCGMANREAAVLGKLNHCDVPDKNTVDFSLLSQKLAEKVDVLESENKRLREALERGLGAVNVAYQQAQAEYHNHDIKADKLDKIVCDWRNEARAALKGEG